ALPCCARRGRVGEGSGTAARVGSGCSQQRDLLAGTFAPLLPDPEYERLGGALWRLALSQARDAEQVTSSTVLRAQGEGWGGVWNTSPHRPEKRPTHHTAAL